MNNYILTTDLSAYEAALKNLSLWTRLKEYVRENCHKVAAAAAGRR